MKCDITSTDYESTGCLNCMKHNWSCNLVRGNKGEVLEAPTPSVSTIVSTPTSRSGSGSRSNQKITKQYLKDRFKFVSMFPLSQQFFTILFPNHPKEVMASNENKFHHEWVNIQDSKNKSNDEDNFIKNRNVYDFLVSIDAFTLGSREIPISRENLVELLKIYFFKINSLFPIVHEPFFWEDFKNNQAQSLVIYAMVLVIARDKLAQPILRDIFYTNFGELSNSQFDEKLQSYMTDLEYKIRQVTLILPQLGVDEKLPRLIVSLLLSLHFNFNLSGNELSSHDLTDAINLAVSLGIHQKTFGDLNPQVAEYSTKLWWCCYIFDRFNGFNNSRCLFIHAVDFNVDLPYNSINLLKLVQLGRSIENMVSAVYRPFHTDNWMDTRNRYKMFNIEDFEKMEFGLCEKERSTIANPYEFVVDRQLANVDAYVSQTIHFLSRIINNVVIILGQKAKYDDPAIPDSVPETAATTAALNIIWYFSRMKDELMTNVYILPWAIAVPMALALKQKLRLCLQRNDDTPGITPDFTYEDAIASLERFSSTWWVVDEICKQSREFVNKLEGNQTGLKRLMSLTDVRQYKKVRQEPTNSVQLNNILQPVEVETKQHANQLSFMPINMDISDIQFDKYFESMQFDIFNNDIFKDVVN